MKKVYLLFLMLSMFTGYTLAQTIQIGSGTATNTTMPITSCWGYSYTQQIFTKAQINTAGNIEKIRFYYVSGTTTNNLNWTVYLGHTTKTSFSSTTDWVPLTGLTQVFSGNVTYPAAGNWLEITLSSPFAYNNVDNLVVAVDENTPSYTCSITWRSFTSGTNTGIYYRDDVTNPNPSAPPTASGRTGTLSQIQLAFPEACSSPSALVVSNVSATSATISWTAPGTAPSNGYEWEVRTSGAGGSGATGLAASGSTAAGVTTANVTGLTAATSYNLYVRSNCGASTYSTWAGPTAFATLCESLTEFSESFEAVTFPPTCWSLTGSSSWVRSAACSGYGVGLASAKADFYNISSGVAFSLVSPNFNLANPQLSFDHAYATYSTQVDKLVIYYSTNNGSSFTQLEQLLGGASGPLNTAGAYSSGAFTPSSTQWATKTYLLPVGTNAIKLEGVSAYGNNLYLDNIVIEEAPQCFVPDNIGTSNIALTSATISWDAANPVPAGGYDYELRTSGLPGSGATGLVASGNTAGLSVNFTNLTSGTYYNFYIQSNCGGGEVSIWSAATLFSTLCSPVTTYPWTEGFEGAYFPPVCWQSLDEDNDGYNWEKVTTAALYPSHSGTGSAGSASYDNPTSTALTPDNWLISPQLNIPATGEFVLDYYVAAQDPDFAAEKYGVYISTTGTDPANFTEVFVETLSSEIYLLRTVNLFAYNGQSIYIAWRHYDVTDMFWMKIDDVTVRMLPPACPTPQAQPTALVLTPQTNSVGGSFTASPTATGYLVLASTSSTLTTLPQNKTTYTAGTTLGDATVVYSGTGTTFTHSSLTAATQYYYFVFAYATGAECSGPIYRTNSPLTGNVITLPAAPAAFTATATSASQVTFSATPNDAGNNIIVAWNTSNTFGSPTGSLVAGQTITGGGTVHYVGSAAGLYAHAGLMEGTTYYYRIWTVVSGPKYSSTYLNANATTFYSVPYIQDFNAALTLPGGWAGTGSVFAISSTHGNNSSNGLYKNIYSSVPNANVSTPTIIVPPGSPCRLVFDYRIVNYSSYPSTATTLGASDKVEVLYSIDNGSTYNVLFTINQANHITSTAFANTRIDLSALSGPVKFQFLATWGAGDYYVDIDNFKVEVTPTEPIFTINPSSKDFGTVSIFGVSAPQIFTFSNEGIGTINLSGTTITGTNPADFILVDNNAYPLILGEGQSATVQVYFDPSSAGAKAANLVLSEANDGKLNHTVSLTGVGLDPTVVSFPFRETFEPASPSRSGWLAYNADGGGTNWAYTTAQNHTPGGTTSAYHVYYSSADQEGWFITPPIQLPAGSDYALSFWSYNAYPLDYDKNSVLISTGSMNPNDGEYVEIWTTDEVVASWVETAGLSLGAYAGQQIYIAFKYEGLNAHNWYIDDVLINTPLNVTFESTPLSCNGSNDGTITLNIVGGTPPYTINVLGPNDYFGDQATLTNLAAGEYYYSVTDAEPTTASGTIVITQPDAIPTPTAESLTVTYDGMLHTINAVAPVGTSLVWYNAASGGEVTEAPSETNAGVYNAWVAAFDAVAGCESTRVAVVLTINKKGLTVTADNKTKCQFTPNPELTFAYAGFVAGEGPENLETAPTATTTALTNSAPGTYPITLGGGVSSNYSFTYVNATLTVIKSPIVNAGPDGAVCSGESFQFVAASASNYTTILWSTSGNGTFSSTSAVNPVYTPGSLDIANGSATLTLTGDPGSSCSQQSSMVLTIQNDLQVSVEVIQVTEDVCVGTLVHFMALPTNGGLTPAYQWKVNGTNAGTNSADFAYVPANNDVVTVVLTSSIGCALNNPAISAPLTVHVTSDLTAGVSIFANATSVCDFTSVTFTAVPENGGSNPSYQWFVNNVASGANASTFSFIPLDGDDVHVVMTSNHACAVVPVATSNTVEMHVAPPFLELFANPVNGGTVTGSGNYPAGTAVTVVATPTPGWEFLNWKNADGMVISTNASYVHTINYCYEALTATFSSTAKIAGQLKYFNNQETIIPSPNNYGVFYVQLFEGETAIGERQLLRYNAENGMDSYYEYIGVESGKDYKLRVWEQATNNQLGNVWTWNNYGGTTAADALIIGYMTASNPIVEQLPWIAPVAVPNYTPLFNKVADLNNSNSLTGVDALLLQFAMTNPAAYLPLSGGAHNFMFATTRLSNHGAVSYPTAPGAVFTPYGNYDAATTASEVYHEVMLTNLSDGLNVYNIYLVAAGDVNASYKPGSGAKEGGVLNYNGMIASSKGSEVVIPVRIDQSANLAAMTLGFSFDNQLIEVIDVEGYPIHHVDAEAGTVRISWVDQNGKNFATGETLVNVKVKILGDLNVGSRYFELLEGVEFADVTATVLSGISLTSPYIETGVTGIEDLNMLSLTHNSYPNPFSDNTRISYVLPEAGKVSVVVYNYFGQQVKTLVAENQVAGQHQIELNRHDLRDAGQYFYRITLEGQMKTWQVRGTVVFVK